ncbi:helix-turn-helix domain-containing protein [Sphingomonas sp. QA11]|uniref:helix-turn-helix domain-containing protein n=1 Tax=Sphingomonas sp. QA11 TaxID=2950605 RepID=UPI00234A8ADF|nr:helix-turn-helix domain-containing protein [Sphingomonas sp. QA11]WCM25002.1 helix-turn-helix domain-containing protein [Sphingomonas sp. QA11]
MTDLPQRLGTQPEPVSVRIDVAARMIGLSRSKVYELIDEGAIRTVKVGRARLVPVANLRAFLAVQTDC